MKIVLICKHKNGQASFAAEQIEGIPAPERRYDIIDGTIKLSGYPDVVIHHDADELLRGHAGIYRMPTPQEQNEMATAEQRKSQAEEYLHALHPFEIQEEATIPIAEIEEAEQGDEKNIESTIEPSAEKPKRTYTRKAK